jgi:hypothetical protein
MGQLRSNCYVNGEWRIYYSVDMALICAGGTSEEVLSVIRFLLRGCRPNLRYFAAGFYRPILRRVGRDRDLQDLIWKALQDTDNPSESERGSFLSLLVSVQGLTPSLREWCRNECDQPPDSNRRFHGNGYRYRSGTAGWRFLSDCLAREPYEMKTVSKHGNSERCVFWVVLPLLKCR